jgi:hypothetical protein
MTRHFALAAAGGALLILASSAPAFAANPDFCRDYARAAVRQTREAQSHDRCMRHMGDDHTRWSTDFPSHYNWCLSVHRDQADSERDARRDMLDRCAH